MRVKDRNTAILLDVLEDHVLQQGRLPHAGPADYVDVLAPVSLLDAKRLFLASPVGGSDDAMAIPLPPEQPEATGQEPLALGLVGGRVPCASNSGLLCVGHARRRARAGGE